MDFSQSNYLKLGTYRKNGARVDTPIWFADGGDGYFYAFSNNQAGKVKRLRNFSKVDIAPCTVTGKVLGAWQSTEAEILESPAVALAALRRRYGWQMRSLNFLARLGGKFHARSYLRIRKPQECSA